MTGSEVSTGLNSKQNVKRAIQVLVPGVPAPVVDYALNTPFFASIVAPGGGVRRRTSSRDLRLKPTFVLREMDSGDWGELSLTSPVHRKYHRDTKFTDSSLFSFEMPAANTEHGTGKGRR